MLLSVRAADRRSAAAARRALVSRELVLLPLIYIDTIRCTLVRHAAASAHGLAASSGAGSAARTHPTNHAAYAAACSRNGGTAATASTSPGAGRPHARTATRSPHPYSLAAAALAALALLPPSAPSAN